MALIYLFIVTNVQCVYIAQVRPISSLPPLYMEHWKKRAGTEA